MANATLSQLQARVTTNLRDSVNAYIDLTDINAWLNEAYYDLAARFELLERETAATTAAGFTIALPTTSNTETLEILSLRLGSADDVLFVDSQLWNDMKDKGLSPSATIGRVFGANIELYPTPTTGTAYVLRCNYIPAPLASGADVHVLPLQVERKLVEYATAKSKYKDGQLDEGDRLMMLYEQGLPKFNASQTRHHPGPWTLLPEPGPFDLDPDAQHV